MGCGIYLAGDAAGGGKKRAGEEQAHGNHGVGGMNGGVQHGLARISDLNCRFIVCRCCSASSRLKQGKKFQKNEFLPLFEI